MGRNIDDTGAKDINKYNRNSIIQDLVSSFNMAFRSKDKTLPNKDALRERLENILMAQNVDEHTIYKLFPKFFKQMQCNQEHPAHCYNVLRHTIKVVEGVRSIKELRLAAFLHDTGKLVSKTTGKDGVDHFDGHEKESVSIAEKILNNLGYEKDVIDKVIKIIEYHDTEIPVNKEGVRKFVEKLGREEFELLMLHQEADLLAHSKKYADKKIGIIKEIDKIYIEEYKGKILDKQ